MSSACVLCLLLPALAATSEPFYVPTGKPLARGLLLPKHHAAKTGCVDAAATTIRAMSKVPQAIGGVLDKAQEKEQCPNSPESAAP